MRIRTKNQKIQLLDSDFIAQGGEGSIYAKNGTAYKVYTNPSLALQQDIPEKVDLLKQIQHPQLLTPQESIFSEKGEFVGYSMPYIKGEPLARLFSTQGQATHGLTPQKLKDLVNLMHESLGTVHSKQALVVDCNELNWLVAKGKPYLVDTDSWQIGKFPATALMPSIKDWHGGFSPLTDWFAWGILTFQLFTGIHPYKGSHPDYARMDMEGRMRNNISVFNPNTRLNNAVRDFSLIPTGLLDWYRNTFEAGNRSIPPLAEDTAPKIRQATLKVRQTQSGLLTHKKLAELAGIPIHAFENGFLLVQEADQVSFYDIQFDKYLRNPEFTLESVPVRQDGTDFIITPEANRIRVTSQGSNEFLGMTVSKVLVWNNRCYVLRPDTEYGLTELNIANLGSKLVLSLGNSYPVAEKATAIFRNMAVMQALNNPFVIRPTATGIVLEKAPYLTGYTAIDGYASSEKVYILAKDNRTGKSWLIQSQGDTVLKTEQEQLSVTTNSTGVTVEMPDTGSIKVSKGTLEKEIKDSTLDEGFNLFSACEKICYFQGTQLFQLKLQ